MKSDLSVLAALLLLFACTPENNPSNGGNNNDGGGNAQPTVVDLGLSVKWAECNLGASTPEEYGDYYAWGETEPKENYSWPTYKWCNGSDNSLTLTKYNTKSSYGRVDNKVVLDATDDVVKARLGGKWRMPTDAELTELISQCTWTWTTQKGVNGYEVTSKINGNSIFLPAAGGGYERSPYFVGSSGFYWSSSLSTGYPSFAWGVYFNSDNVNRDDNIYRFYGLSVRPVSE